MEIYIRKYIDDNEERPSGKDKNKKIKFYSNWLSHQIKKYITREGLMNDEKIRKLWYDFINHDDYKEYFLSNKEYWINTLEKIKKYIHDNNMKPSNNDTNIKVKSYAKWIGTQQINYQKKEQIMKEEKIRKLWELFINGPIYSTYF